ncbi:carboxymuconolactone decarboxylase family protein [Galbibacter sp. PAP.153]|uniref:carboxymuconolactone decarboxylase family protein n=1 Tax=Galbibacter sp. PAP.153 TaxID=3104623 RepID=UPI003008A5F2
MEKRIQIDQVAPNGYKSMYAIEKYIGESDLNPTHKELIKMNASYINGCAFCIDMHSKDAIKNGETAQRLLLISAWRETDVFTEEEKLILEITEEITLIHQQGLTKETYKKALATFGEKYLANIILAITAINMWNRIAVSTHKPLLK